MNLDLLEHEVEQVTGLQFLSAHEFVMRHDLIGAPNSFLASMTPSQSIHLTAIFKQATVGLCTGSPAYEADVAERRQWKEWKELGNMSKLDAQRAFVDEVLFHCKSLESVPGIPQFLADFASIRIQNVDSIMMREKSVTEHKEEPLQTPLPPRPSAVDLKTMLSTLSEETYVLSSRARDDLREVGMAEQVRRAVSDKAEEAVLMRQEVDELGNDLQSLIKQLDSALVAAVSRRKWSYEQIEGQCEELMARSETCANTYKNQSTLAATSSSLNFTYLTYYVLLPIGAGLTYWWYRKKARKLKL